MNEKMEQKEILTVESNEIDYIFRDEDFGLDHEDFDAVAFVTRFRRVTPMESLREQLRAYSNNIRKQLYAIINRDYKDFISIATKLDGLDTRLMLIERPLLDLRINLSSLHNGITTGLHTINDKINQRKEVVERRHCLELLLSCMDELSAAQAVVQSTPGSSTASRHQLYKSLELLRVMDNKDDKTTAIHEEDGFICSEFESAAVSLQAVSNHLATLSSPSSSIKAVKSLASLPMLTHVVEEQLKKTQDALLDKIRSRVENYFTTAATSGLLPSQHQDANELLREYRGFAHCLRALVAIGKGNVAEEVLAQQVLGPQLRTLLSAGKVDGEGGKGFFSGLRTSLQGVLHFISSHQLLSCLLVACHLHLGGSLDLPERGILQPIFQHITEKFGQIFSIGIASIFSTCYRSLHDFVAQLGSLLNLPPGQLLQSGIVRSFLAQFKLETYYQLRCREVMIRTDKICELHVKSLSQISSSMNLMDAVYRTSSGSADKTTAVLTKAGTSLSLPSSEIDRFISSLGLGKKFWSPVFQAFTLELITCLHGDVALIPVYGKMVGLVQRLCLRLALHLSLLLAIPLPSIFASKNEMETMRISYFDLGSYNSQTNPSLHSAATPAKISAKTPVVEPSPVKSTPSKVPPSTPSSSVSSQNLALPILPLDVHVRLARDAWLFLLFLRSEGFAGLLGSCSTPLVAVALAGSWPFVNMQNKPGEEGLENAILLIWKQFTVQIAQDCKKALNSVKAIAGKYRMTNKPAPTSCSPYVETILGPLRSLIQELGESLSELALGCETLSNKENWTGDEDAKSKALQRWKEEVCDSITSSFREQIIQLFDTVKQMDSALQRRAKIGASGSSNSAGNDSLRDSDKIAMQVQLDVQAYGEDLRRLGAQHQGIDNLLKEVEDMVRQQLQNK